MAHRERKSRLSLQVENLLAFAAGLMLSGYGAVRLQQGTSGLAESITACACVVSGVCFLIATLFGVWLAVCISRGEDKTSSTAADAAPTPQP